MEAPEIVRAMHRPAPERHSDRIAAGLRDDILRGRYKAGERLPPERVLAARLAVNRGSVREALKKLEQLGLVEIRRGDGALVRRLDQASIEVVRDLIRVEGGFDRALLEQVLDVHEMLLVGASVLAVERLNDASMARAREIVAGLFAPGRSALDLHVSVEALVEIATDATGHLVLRLFRNTFKPAILEGVRTLGPYLEVEEADAGLEAAVDALGSALASRDAEVAAASVRRLSSLFRARLRRALDAYDADRANR